MLVPMHCHQKRGGDLSHPKEAQSGPSRKGESKVVIRNDGQRQNARVELHRFCQPFSELHKQNYKIIDGRWELWPNVFSISPEHSVDGFCFLMMNQD